mmetsp:Transcript_40838/g.64775  ORF Transcript_40838/g.64775 Transcript_40838/m.64775 type:complete len:207 (+) Transcript_40838:846-1466(+)
MILLLASSYVTNSTIAHTAARPTVAEAPVYMPTTPSCCAMDRNAWKIFLYRLPSRSACIRTLIISQGLKTKDATAPLPMPANILAPMESELAGASPAIACLKGSYRPMRALPYVQERKSAGLRPLKKPPTPSCRNTVLTQSITPLYLSPMTPLWASCNLTLTMSMGAQQVSATVLPAAALTNPCHGFLVLMPMTQEYLLALRLRFS